MFGFAMYQEAKWKGAELADEEERALLARGRRWRAMTTDEEDARREAFILKGGGGKRASEGGEGGETGRSGGRARPPSAGAGIPHLVREFAEHESSLDRDIAHAHVVVHASLPRAVHARRALARGEGVAEG